MPEVSIPSVTLHEHLFDRLSIAQRSRPAIVDNAAGARLTYGELADDVGALAGALAARGMHIGAVVGLYAPNSAAFVVALHGALRAGATMTPINVFSTNAEVTRQLSAAGASWIMTVSSLLPAATSAALANGISVDRVIVLDGEHGLAALLSERRPAPDVHFDPAEHVAVLPFSSGTTGAPKGVRLTHRNLVANIEQTMPGLALTDQDRVLATLPLFHIYGLNIVLNATLRAGSCIVIMERFDLEGFLATIQDERCTLVFGAPPIALALAKTAVVDEYDLSSMRSFLSGAASLDGDLAAAVERRTGARVSQGYGMTEASPGILSTPLGRTDIPAASVGVLISNMEARIIDVESGLDIDAPAPGEMSAAGELWVRGDNVMRGYLDNPEASDSTVDADGYLHTGDIVTVHSDGWFMIVDRLKELIKYKGYQIAPSELEATLLLHPAVRDAAVIGVLDDERQEVPQAFVVVDPEAHTTAAELMGFVAERVAPHKKVRRVAFISAIPRSAAGKVLRRELRDGLARPVPHTRFPLLLSPVRVGRVELPNRVMMGSMHLGLEERPDGFVRMAEFYAERARGGVGLIVTGGIAPAPEGGGADPAAVLHSESDVADHRLITEAVHAAGGRVLMQLLHAGRYARRADAVAPSAISAPNSRRLPRAMTDADIRRTVGDYASSARLAISAGYDGIELMGSEGYLLNQFLAPVTNHRDDEWGGDAVRRRAFPLAVVRAVRAAIGADPILSFRISAVDLVPGGSTRSEVFALARELEAAGVDLLVTGVGWHESRIPTIATLVPRAAFSDFSRDLRAQVSIPVAASNRINTPEVAESLLTAGDADMISMARPLLADAAFVAKALTGEGTINTCIGCNQACIDHAFTGQVTSCLVNPRACHETILVLAPTRRAKRVAVVGGGPAGLSAARSAAERGHRVTLFEQHRELGGQFDLAQRVPGKEEFAETLRYFRNELDRLGVDVRTGHRATADELTDFDDIIIATGVSPRRPRLQGSDLSLVVDYAQVLRGERTVGEQVIILGAGGIGFDVAQFLTEDGISNALDNEAFRETWGITTDVDAPGGVTAASVETPRRRITMLQRKASKPGAGLGPTTGWIHRTELRQRGVSMLADVQYNEIVPTGIRVVVHGQEQLLAADTIVLCTGQESERLLAEELIERGLAVHIVGGARLAGELDAKRAIHEGVQVAAAL